MIADTNEHMYANGMGQLDYQQHVRREAEWQWYRTVDDGIHPVEMDPIHRRRIMGELLGLVTHR